MANTILCLEGERVNLTRTQDPAAHSVHRADEGQLPLAPFTLSQLPYGDEIQQFLEKAGSTLSHCFFYDQNSQTQNTAIYVTVNSGREVCYMVQGNVTHDQADMIKVRLNEGADVSKPSKMMLPRGFEDCVYAVLGERIDAKCYRIRYW